MKIISKTSDELQMIGEDIECLLWQNGFLLSAGSSNGTVKVWNGDLTLVNQFQAHDYPVYHMTTGESSDTFYTGSNDSTIRSWEINDKGQCKLLNILSGHKDAVRRLRVFGNRLFSGDELGEIRVWENGKEICEWNTDEEIWDLVVDDTMVYTVRDRDISCNQISQTGDNKMRLSSKNVIPGRGPICILDNKLCFVDRTGMKIEIHGVGQSGNPLLGQLTGHTAIINSTAGAKNVLYSGGWDKQIIKWDITEFISKEQVEVPGYVNASILNPDGILFVAGENYFIAAIN